MKEHTVKLSGHAKDRFLERFFADEPALETNVRQRLVARATSAFTSLRVRKAMLARQRVVDPSSRPSKLRSRQETAAPVEIPPLLAEPPPSEPAAPVTAAEAPPPSAPEPAPEAPFDAYAFGLVPVFQREGPEGLLARLSGVALVDQLRQMAKAQQVVLPLELRVGDATADAIRAGIVAAVAKRIADRRAAAG